jgi:predicted 3-demethylubiquinone-9 3-methyltransferase (glyoxalase superfamily)
MSRITTYLWFGSKSQEAAEYYVSVFDDARLTGVEHFGEAGPLPAGTVLTASFEIGGHPFVALNGGDDVPWTFNESVSFQVDCADQAEVDRLWDRLVGDGGEESQCGWCKDRYGVSWQVIPRRLNELMADPDRERAQRAMKAMLGMRKIDVAELERAADGG